MRKFVTSCDGCGKSLEFNEEEGSAIIYHNLSLNFRTFMIDPNTKMEEEVSNMARETRNLYCNDCFMTLANHMDSFLEEVSSKIKDDDEIFKVDISKEAMKIQSNEIDGLEAAEIRNKKEDEK